MQVDLQLNPAAATLNSFKFGERYMVLNTLLPISHLFAASISFVVNSLCDPMIMLLAKDLADKFELLGDLVSASTEALWQPGISQEQIRIIRFELGYSQTLRRRSSMTHIAPAPSVKWDNWTNEEFSSGQASVFQYT
jgi:hypothetical protein